MVAAVVVAWARGMPEASAQSDPWAVPVAEFDFPDPDLAPVTMTDDQIEAIRQSPNNSTASHYEAQR